MSRLAFVGASVFLLLVACSKKPQPSSAQDADLSPETIAAELVSKDPDIRAASRDQAMRISLDLRKSMFSQPLAKLMRTGDPSTQTNAIQAALGLGLQDETRAAILDSLGTKGLSPDELRVMPWNQRSALSTLLLTGKKPELARLAFIYRIVGRWKESYIRKSNRMWSTNPALTKAETDWVISPEGIVIESRPEFQPPSTTASYSFDSLRQVSDDLFDLDIGGDVKRIRLPASDGNPQLEVVSTAEIEKDPEPTVQILTLVKADWSGDSAAPK